MKIYQNQQRERKMTDYCDLCDALKEVTIDSDRLRVCKECDDRYPENKDL